MFKKSMNFIRLNVSFSTLNIIFRFFAANYGVRKLGTIKQIQLIISKMMPVEPKTTGIWDVDTIITFSVCYVHHFVAEQDNSLAGFSLHASFL